MYVGTYVRPFQNDDNFSEVKISKKIGLVIFFSFYWKKTFQADSISSFNPFKFEPLDFILHTSADREREREREREAMREKEINLF
jgi:hypothetical protein